MGSEYIALATVADGDKPANGGAGGAGGHGRNTSLAQGLSGIDSRGQGGVLGKVSYLLATDLRIRFVAMFCGLWALNLVYPSSS